MQIDPRARDYTESQFGRMIPDESELTAGVTIEPGKSLRLLHRHDAAASAARPARSPARSGTRCPPTISASPGTSYDNTGGLSAQHLAARRVHREDRRGRRARDRDAAVPEQLADDERRLQALPQRALPRGLPDRRAVPHRVRYRGRAAGHLQRLRLLRAGLPVRRRRISVRDDGKAHKCTLCYDRLKGGLEPACAKSCPTNSIQFGELHELHDRAQQRVEDAARHGRGERLSLRHAGRAGRDRRPRASSTPSSC